MRNWQTSSFGRAQIQDAFSSGGKVPIGFWAAGFAAPAALKTGRLASAVHAGTAKTATSTAAATGMHQG